MLQLQHKICLITGGASGIGEGAARRFAEEGAVVVIADIQRERGERVAEQIRAQGGLCDFRLADMGQADEIASLFGYIDNRYGGLDVLFTCAFWSVNKNAEDMSPEEWNRCLNVTLTAPFLCSKGAIPLMRRRGGGSIIHTSSVGGVVAFRNSAAYMAAKAGVIHLCKSIAVDFGRDKIRCNAICPGIVDTPDTRADDTDEHHRYRMSKCLTGRFGNTDDIANAALFLASSQSDYMTGSVMTIDSGWSII